MSIVIKDRVKETSSIIGTGPILLDGAQTGYQAFNVIGNGNKTFYCIADQIGSNWEVGIGTYNSSINSISRDTVLASNNNGDLVFFNAGFKDVFVTYPAENALYVNELGDTSISGAFSSGSISTGNLTYTGTLTGSSGIMNIGSGQFYKDSTGNVGVNTSSPSSYGKFAISTTTANDGVNIVFPGSPGTAAVGTNFWLTNNTTVIKQAYINAQTDGGSVGAENAHISFGTIGSGTLSERMRIDSSGNLAIGATSAAVKLVINSTDAILLPKGTTANRPTGVSGYLRFNTELVQFEGHNGTTWGTIGGASISNDTTTASNLYPIFANATTGTATTVYTGNAKLLYKPSTGELSSTAVVSTNGITINSATIAADYTIATGNNGCSAGPVTVNSGITVTVSSGSTWVVV